MLITVDWLSFRVRSLPENDIFSFLGIFETLKWRVGGAVYNNYTESLRYGHITIGLNGQKGYDFYVDMSGQGCREFEDLMPDGWSWEQFIFRLAADERVTFARLDVAGDEHEGYFDIERLDFYVKHRRYATKCNIPEVTKYGKEIVRVGSPQSKMKMRIYNKKLERGFSPEDDDGRPWWRCEMEIHDDYCAQFIAHWREYGIGYAYAGHCKNHIRWLMKSNTAPNSNRIKTAKWYDDFLGACEKLKFTSAVGSEYNISKLQKYCLHSAGSSVVTLAKFFNMTPEQFYNYFMENDEIKLRPDQIDLLNMRGLK